MWEPVVRWLAKKEKAVIVVDGAYLEEGSLRKSQIAAEFFNSKFGHVMDAKYGIGLGNGNGAAKKSSFANGMGPNFGKENENFKYRVEYVNGNSPRRGGLKATGKEDKDSVIVTASRSSNAIIKKSGAARGNHSKNDKMPKDQASQRGLTVALPRKQMLGFSQSLTPSSNGIPTSGLRKSNVQKQTKLGAKDSIVNGTKAVSLALNGVLISTSRSSSSNNRASSAVGVNYGGTSSRQNTLPSKSIIKRSMAPTPANESIKSAASKARVSHERTPNPPRQRPPIKENKVVRSTTTLSTASHGLVQSRSRVSSSFRFDGHDANRKLVVQKNNAKEVGKTNLQEKSKVRREAEIKQQGKSLALKATPMQVSYKEPRPTKLELRKMPKALPKSPKVEQQKSSVTVTDRPRTRGGSGRNSYSSIDRSKAHGSRPQVGTGNTTSSKKPVQMSLSKLSAQKQSVVKLKVTDSRPKTQKTSIRGTEWDLVKSVEDSPPKIEDNMESCSVLDDIKEDGVIISLPDPDELMMGIPLPRSSQSTSLSLANHPEAITCQAKDNRLLSQNSEDVLHMSRREPG